MLKRIVVMMVLVFVGFSAPVFAGSDGCYVGCQDKPKVSKPVVKRTTVVRKYYMNGVDKQARERLDAVEPRVSSLETLLKDKASAADVNSAFAETNGRIDRVENRMTAIENWWTLSPFGWFLLFLATIALIAAIIGGYFFPRNNGGAAVAVVPAPQPPAPQPAPIVPPYQGGGYFFVPALIAPPPADQSPVEQSTPPATPVTRTVRVEVDVNVTGRNATT